MTQANKYAYELMVHTTIRKSQASENRMEALELDMPSDTASILKSMPPLEDLSLNSQD